MASHDQVAHRWAQMNSNLSITGHHMWADGLTIYSYGRHFPIARWTETAPKKGADVPAMCVMFNADGHSVSTAKHKTITRRAIRDSAWVFTVPQSLWDHHGAAMAYFEAQALESLQKATRARVYSHLHIEDAERYLGEAERYALAFAVRYKRPDFAELKAKAAKASERAHKAALAAAKERAKREAAQRVLDAGRMQAWYDGEADSHVPSSYRYASDGSAYIRRSPDGESLETSQGASVPWAHAVRAFQFVKLCRERGETWQRNGHAIRVGHFEVDRIDSAGNMTAGCHRFTWEAMHALAVRHGVFDAPASADAVEQRA